MEHCCHNMTWYASNKNDILQYDADCRAYHFLVPNGRNGTHQSFSYCPWCGKELPKDLEEEWGEALEKELGITDPFIDPGYENLPEEFRTDAWWKKRGL